MRRKATVTVCASRKCGFLFTRGYDWTLHSIIGMKTLYYASDTADCVTMWYERLFWGRAGGRKLGRNGSDSHKWNWKERRSNRRKQQQSGTSYFCHTGARARPLVPCSCRCRWCMSRRVGSTPPASASAGWGSGGSGWTPWLAASGCGSGPSPSTAAGWWLTHSQRYWRTSGLEMGDRVRVRNKGGF